MMWLTWVVGVLVALMLLVVGIGLVLPRNHVATRTLEVRESPEPVWDLISDFKSQVAWRPDVKEVARVSDENGHDAWRETYTDGMTLTFETVAADPPNRLVRRIVDTDKGFGGDWEYRITGTPGGSELAITEHGEVSNPFYRFMSRFFMGHTAMIDRYLGAVARRFNEEAIIH